MLRMTAACSILSVEKTQYCFDRDILCKDWPRWIFCCCGTRVASHTRSFRGVTCYCSTWRWNRRTDLGVCYVIVWRIRPILTHAEKLKLSAHVELIAVNFEINYGFPCHRLLKFLSETLTLSFQSSSFRLCISCSRGTEETATNPPEVSSQFAPSSRYAIRMFLKKYVISKCNHLLIINMKPLEIQLITYRFLYRIRQPLLWQQGYLHYEHTWSYGACVWTSIFQCRRKAYQNRLSDGKITGLTLVRKSHSMQYSSCVLI